MAFFSGRLPREFAHRGSSGTHPENTIEAFEAAREAGVAAFELDVHAAADGEIVVIHDATLERTTDGSGAVREHDLSSLKKLDAGYGFTPDGGRTFPFRDRGVRIPTLAEVLEAFPGVPMIIEIKQVDPPLESRLHAILEDHGAGDHALVFSLKQRPLDRYRTLGAGHQTGMGPEDVTRFKLRLTTRQWRGYDPPGVAFAVPVRFRGIPVVTPRFIRAAHRIDREVYVWTVNEERQMEDLLDMGVDGLISNYPGRLRAVVEARAAVDTPKNEG